MKISKIETFYTGGGIWLTAASVENSPLYYILDSDWDDGLTLYDRTDEDDDTEFPCQNMVWSKETAELTKEEKALLRDMKRDMWYANPDFAPRHKKITRRNAR